jgi:hypothetical protein
MNASTSIGNTKLNLNGANITEAPEIIQRDCQETSESLKELQPLFEKLARARFTGKLILSFEAGQISSAFLQHYLPLSELRRELPTIEEVEFTLRP